MAGKILILSDPEGELEELGSALASEAGEGSEVDFVPTAAELLKRLSAAGAADLVVVDYFLGDGSRTGLQVIGQLRDLDAEIPVVAVAETGDVESAAAAIDAGASDFLVRGKRLQERVSTLMGKVRNLLGLMERNRVLREQNRRLREADLERYRIVGDSPEIVELVGRVGRVAAVPRPVLIVGERGTGKELIARAVHAASGPAERPIVTVNCAAFTDTLLESELFGHEKGSFTGAEATVQGRFEQARGGTLFLDEIGNMSLSFQQKILRVVEYGSFTRVGGSEEITTDARIIAATNVDLVERIRGGEFLQDLYDRLAFEVIDVPPLRERTGDVDVLARHFLQQFMREIPAFRGKRLAESALEMLRGYEFPGNVRELKNIIERAAYRDVTNEITPVDLGMLPRGTPPPKGGAFEEQVEGFRKGLIGDALEAAGGNKAAAARSLGLSYHRFRYYHDKYFR